ncbi:hypothetical protein L0F63_001818 [Massospora cicadina]|nr:hypothetical protein L0F63_001818 [Massospora cicadina]
MDNQSGDAKGQNANQKDSVRSNLSFSYLFDTTHQPTTQSNPNSDTGVLCTSPEDASSCFPNRLGDAALPNLITDGQSPVRYDNAFTNSGDSHSILNITRGGLPVNNNVEHVEALNQREVLPGRGATVPFPDGDGGLDPFQPASYGTSCTNISGCEVILSDGTKARRKITLSTTSDFQKKSWDHLETNDERRPLLPKPDASPPSAIRRLTSELPSVRRGLRKLPSLTLPTKAVIKSTLSYFCGSLLTFIPLMRGIIGTSSHMAAISGFFLNPGMSVGKFVESMTFGILFVAYGLVVGYLSLANMAFWNRWGYPMVARSSTLLVFIGVASFILAFIKAHYPKPTVVKCIPNAFIFIYIVLINYTPFVEADFDPFKIYDLAKTLSCGILLNFVICTQLWPRWEVDKLRDDMAATLESFRHSLAAIVKTFLMEEAEDLGGRNIEGIMAAHRKGFHALKLRYEAAQWEFYFEPERYNKLGGVIDCLNRLGQKLGGLSSGIDAQRELLGDLGMDLSTRIGPNRRHSKFPKFKTKHVSVTLEAGRMDLAQPQPPVPDDDAEPDVEVLFHFLRLVGPPTQSLTYTCQQAILKLALTLETFGKVAGGGPRGRWEAFDPGQLRENIRSALSLFSEAQSRAMSTLYRRTRYDGRPGEEIFLVYFFVFSLEEFASELVLAISAFEGLARAPTLTGPRWWINFRAPFSALWMVGRALALKGLERARCGLVSAKGQDTVEPLHHPSTNTASQRLGSRIWYFLMALRDHRVVYATKCAFVATLVASPCYLLGYREQFYEWRVGWTLITINLVMSPTIGASNIYGLYRALGTLAGSVVAYAVYSIFSHNALALTLVSALIAAPCMYIFLNTSVPRFGQFLLLSYNLIVLTTYANRHDVEFSFARYAFVRSFSVLLGVLIGLLFSSLVLPYEARREFRLGLSSFFLKLSGLYLRLVEMHSVPAADPPRATRSLGSGASGCAQSLHQFLELELGLQLQLLELGELLSHTAHEPRLKGPFPASTYRQVLQSCQVLLDKFVAMRIVVTKDEWQARVRADFVVPLNGFRSDLVGNVVLYFYILASALHLKSPLPPYLPPASLARRRLVAALRDLPVVRNRFLHSDDHHHIFYYAFVVVLDDIVSELEALGRRFKSLYGSQGEAAFERLFRG